MPVHDWTKVISGIFHDFHETWLPEIKNTLNAGVLPEGFYAMLDQVAEGPRPDVLTLETEDRAWESADSSIGGTALAVSEHPPRVRYTEEEESDIYAHAADRIAVYHAAGDRVVAYIELVSPGNKHSEAEVRQFIEKVDDALQRGCHLLVIDILPPTKSAPRGIHAAFWEYRFGDGQGVSDDEPYCLAAYQVKRAGENFTTPKAWIETVGRNRPLPEMPLFLTPEHYVNVPLEATYMTAWNGVPRRWQKVIEAAASASSNGSQPPASDL